MSATAEDVTKTPVPEIVIEHIPERPEQPDPNEPVVAKTPDAASVKPDDVTEGIEQLKSQLAQERQRAAEAEARASTATTDILKFQNERDQSRYNEITYGLSAETAKVEKLEAEYATAMENGNYAGAAKIFSQLSVANTRVVQLSDGKSQMEAYLAQQKLRVPVQPVADAFEQRIGNLSPRTQQWLRNHRDAITDPRKNAAVMEAHHRAVEAGHPVDSDAYFDFVEQEAGYKQRPIPQTTQARTVMSAAAPSRAAAAVPGVVGDRKTIRLTPAQREAAKFSGLTEQEYAKSLIELVKEGELSESYLN